MLKNVRTNKACIFICALNYVYICVFMFCTAIGVQTFNIEISPIYGNSLFSHIDVMVKMLLINPVNTHLAGTLLLHDSE